MKTYIPKIDTQHDEFLRKYPSYDGRGLLIAIMDHGVDMSNSGLQQTSTGLPKIFDCFDFTGHGNIETSVIRQTNKENILIGLHGQKIKIPFWWKNPSGQWHLGQKSMYDLCFGDRKDNVKGTAEDFKELKKDVWSNKTVLECIVWFDGEKWLACCSTTFFEIDDDLENATILTNYRDEHQFGLLLDDIPFCVRIHENGNLLEVFLCSHEHGTIVAHTAAGNFPNDPEKNGVAPGAQIISMNVMTSNNNYMVMNKALLKCIELGVDIINLSITFYPIVESVIKEMMEKHGIIFVHSAGNKGPGCNVIQGHCQQYNDKMFIIGAAFTPEIKNKFFNFPIENCINESPSMCLYSSRGPMNTGSRGITISAPGAVVTYLPKWSPKELSLSYGTSMSSPYVAGSIACLISALKARSIPYSSDEIRLALSNTAFLPKGSDRLAFGNGLIQIYNAFKYFKMTFRNNLHITFNQLSVNERSKCGIYYYLKDLGNGIFLIQKDSSRSVKEFRAKLESPILNPVKLMLSSSTNDAETWIQIPEYSSNNSFNFKIDTNYLKNHSINYAEIHGFNSFNPSIGPLFYFPITVICPEDVTARHNYTTEKDIILKSRIPHRLFFSPPEYFQRCYVKVTALEEISTEICVWYANFCDSKILSFTSKGQTQSCALKIGDKRMCEINICHSNLLNGETSPDSIKLKVEISFKVLFKDQIAGSNSQNETSSSQQNEEEQKIPKSSFLAV